MIMLLQIGLPVDEVQRVSECYRDDEPGLREYVGYMRAVLDDRHEYV